MKKTIIAVIIILILTGLGFYCYLYYQQASIVKNTIEISDHHESQLKNDNFSIKGAYHWTFYLGPAKQISTHHFSDKFIDYKMTGPVHSTEYRMNKLSYDDHEKKWIGQTPEGIVFVLFFKDIDNKTLALYKHKCKQGLPEALTFKRPRDDETADHGWNTYTLEGTKESDDLLPFVGSFIKHDEPSQILTLHDAQGQWLDKKYTKLTHHLGERRWVGQSDNVYLVIFYEQLADGTMNFAMQTYTDIEKAYKSKHDKQTYQKFIQ